MEGENAFGGTVTAVEVDAYDVERVEGVDPIDPTQETVQVGQTTLKLFGDVLPRDLYSGGV